MAKYVTRSIVNYKVTCKVYNNDSDEVQLIVIPHCTKKESEDITLIQKRLVKFGETAYNLLKIEEVNGYEEHYRMLETDFIRLSERY